jgi:type IV pilus assembly protein PilY1
MKSLSIKTLLSAVLLVSPLLAAAEDIDLFIGRNNTTADAPNLMIIMDNGASFSASNSAMRCNISSGGVVKTDGTGLAADFMGYDGKNAGVEQCALYTVIKGIDTTAALPAVNIGFMVFNTTNQDSFDPQTNTVLPYSSNCGVSSSNGGCVVVPMTPLTPDVQTRLLAWIKTWGKTFDIKGNSSLSVGAAMQETWAYFKGKTGTSGRSYSSMASTCGKNFAVYLANDYGTQASPGDSTNAANSPKDRLTGAGPSAQNANPAATSAETTVYTDTMTVQCTPTSNVVNQALPTAENKGAYGLNWATYMHNTIISNNSGITTYAVGITGPSCDTTYAAWLTKLGTSTVGGGKYFQTNDYTGLVTAMNTVLTEVQAVNTVFASVSLPVSVNTQGTYLNQVFIGMFRPDGDAFPRWAGNLKQYKLALVNSDIQLQDADSTAAVSSSTGFITDCARSFWTPTAVDTYWTGNTASKGGCTAIANSTYSNYPDGNVVEKGAQAYQLRSTTTRRVKTCSPTFASCTAAGALTDFVTTNAALTYDLFGLASSSATNPSKDDLVNWGRGMNVANEMTKGTSVMRPSAHGDVVHSRPVALNYGTDASPQVVVFYGSNDGMLHAINGNRTASITSGGVTATAGSELWSFMPPEFFSSIKRLYDNTTTIKFKGSTIVGALPKPYGFDGAITAYKTSTAAWIYSTMRRGGRAVYAFNATTPGSPTLLWKKGCPNNFPTTGTVSDTNCSSGTGGDFSGIGQTWSSAKTIFASGYTSGSPATAQPMLIMGGGYDTCEDSDDGTVNHTCLTATTKGNKIYVLDAATGAIQKAFDTSRAVTGDVTVVADTTTGMIKYAYATDLGGNVYRISGATANAEIGTTLPASWTITRIASLGCSTASSSATAALPCSANRKFLFAPDVVYDNGVYVLLIGSGDREKPLSAYAATYAVPNYFFMIKDDPTDSTWLSGESTNCSGYSVICLNSLLAITTSSNPTQAQVDAKKGWYLALASHEQVVTTSVTVFGTVTFSTHQPAVAASAGSCGSNLGTALVYNIAYTNAAGTGGVRYQDLGGDGLPPSPVAGQVTLDNGQTVPFCIGCSASSPLEGKYKTKPTSASASSYKSRVYWYIEQ